MGWGCGERIGGLLELWVGFGMMIFCWGEVKEEVKGEVKQEVEGERKNFHSS